jgi:hypothetical protein
MGIGRIIIIFGVILVVIGLIITIAGRIPLLGHLPGDIRIDRDNFHFYFPLMTSIIISLLLTVIINVVLWVINR